MFKLKLVHRVLSLTLTAVLVFVLSALTPLTAFADGGGKSPLPEKSAQSVPSTLPMALIDQAVTLGIATTELTSGYQAATTRAEFCRAAVNFLRRNGYDVDGIAPKIFADTNDKDIGIITALGIISCTDTEKNLFSPNQTLNREQAAVMLRNVLDVIGAKYGAPEVAWTDAKDISAWAYSAVNAMYSTEIMGGTSATEIVFNPKAPYTHEECIGTFMNMLSYSLTQMLQANAGEPVEVANPQASLEKRLEERLALPDISFEVLDCKATLETYRKTLLNRPDFAFLTQYVVVVQDGYVASLGLLWQDQSIDYHNSAAVAARKAEFDKRLESYINEIPDNLSEAERVMYVHDCIVRHSDEILAVEGDDGVCDTLSGYFNALAWSVGIESLRVYVQDDTGGHAWNMVNVDCKWYHVDVTWDLGVFEEGYIERDNLLLSDEGIRATGHNFSVPWELDLKYVIPDEYYNARMKPPVATDDSYKGVY